MSVLAGFLAENADRGSENPHLTPALSEYEVDYWPTHESLAGESPQGVLIRAFPVAANPRAITGHLARTYSLDFYYRIHIRPRLLALGDIASTQVTQVEVWNSFFVPKTLASIIGVSAGIELSGQPDPPIIFGGLESRLFGVSVTLAGAASISETVTWNFTALPAAILLITGNRITAWPFAPDWEDGVSERLEWLTDVLPGQTGFEQRRKLRQAPRRVFGAKFIIDTRERTLFDLMMHAWGGNVWALPIWPDIQRLSVGIAQGASSIPCSTAGRDFVAGGLAFLRGESAFITETVEVSGVEADSLELERPTLAAWPAGSRLYPIRTAHLTEQPHPKRLTDQALTTEAEFLVRDACDWPALDSLPLYRGFPVYAARPDETEDLTSTFERLLAVLDVQTSPPLVLDLAELAFDVRDHRWVLGGVEERAAFRSLLYLLKGRQSAVWVPTHADDLQMAVALTSVSVTLTVALVGYARFGLGQLGRTDIRIELRNGTVFHRHVTNAAVLTADTERLTLDTALGIDLTPAEVSRICFISLCRLNDDVVEIHHETDVEGIATSEVSFRGVRDDEL